jgi:hypothetical protein
MTRARSQAGREPGGTDPSPFPNPAAPRRRDHPGRLIELASARLLGRVPRAPASIRRAAAAWRTDHPAPGPGSPGTRSRSLIYAVTAVWNEEDIVYALVDHLHRQGVDRVLVIDDASDDATAEEAAAAGAEVIGCPSDGTYSEALRTDRVRETIARYTDSAGGDVWWLVLDADEFPVGPDGTTVRELVDRAPDWVDVVGSRVLDHVPGPVEYVPRHPPVPFFPLARWFATDFCGRGHWKHPLMRVRRAGDVYPMPGHHTVGTADGRRAREYAPTLLTHHFPLRGRDRTRQKLLASAAPDGRYGASPDSFTRARIAQRLEALDALYAQRYDLVAAPFAGQPRVGITVSEWHTLVPPLERIAVRPAQAPALSQQPSGRTSRAGRA